MIIQNIIGHFGPKPLNLEKVQLQVPITFSSKIQMMQNLSPNWLSWKDIQLWCWRFCHLRLASLKQKGLKLVHFGKISIYMFCTLNFMASFQYFPNSKWIFVQHNICSLCQDLSNHYPHAYVSIFQLAFSKRWSFMINYA